MARAELITAAKQELARRAQRELRRRGAATSLQDFILFTFPEYLMGWFHREICVTLESFLQDVVDGKSPRLIITAPPRSGKSEIVSRRFPAYVLGRYPDTEIIAVSYTADLAQSMNRDVQSIIDSEEYHSVFAETCLRGSAFADKAAQGVTRTSDFFQIVGHKGKYRSTGIGGGITGMGAHILIIDDPVKDRETANSQIYRERAWNWYTSTAYTRLAPGGGVILMCTRWHCDDIAGRLLERSRTGEGEPFHLINYPAIAEHDEPHRKAGEALHPERFSIGDLERIRQNIGSRDFASLYQQRPVPDGGGLFKEQWLNYYTQEQLPARFDKTCISWDMTFKASAQSDFVVGQVWGRYRGNFYLLDQVRGRLDFVATIAAFVKLTNKWPDVSAKLVEDKANGPAIISALRNEVSGIIPISPTEGKDIRAAAVTPFWEAHNVFLPHPSFAKWVELEFLPELLQFPGGAHDDQVDAMTQALTYLKQSGGGIHPSNLTYLGI